VTFMTDGSAPASAGRPDAALVRSIEPVAQRHRGGAADMRPNRDCPDTLMARRKRNFDAMRSPASIALGISTVLLVAFVCAFYDHPAMKTPHMLSSLSHTNAKPL
jgi:hypothetical protein